MTKISVRFLLLSCAFVPALVGSVAHAQTAQPYTAPPAIASPAETLNALNSANAAAAYTGNSSLTQQAAQPGQAMLPTGLQVNPLQQQDQEPVTMNYNKKDAEGSFYGVELPQRLFNNVPSDW